MITECKSGILCDRLGRGLTRKRRRGGKGKTKKDRPRAKVRGSRTSTGDPFEYCL